MTSSLVGSEMCIRDRCWQSPCRQWPEIGRQHGAKVWPFCPDGARDEQLGCLLYTSDAADDM
eukprot:3344946-Prorocentrum_lima.AAC.1